MDKEPGEDGYFATVHGKIFLFLNPFLIAFLFIFLTYQILIRLEIFWMVGGGMTAYFFPPAGKESVIPLLVGAIRSKGTISPLANIIMVGSLIAYLDVISSYFLLYNFYIAEKIPLLGKWIKKFEEFGAHKMKEKTWISKVAFVGIALFVMFPFQGSGGVGASILGKVIGMDKYHAWIAITIGAFSGCIFIATISFYLSGAILAAFQSGIFKGISALIVVIVVFILLYYYSKNHMVSTDEA